MTSEASPVSAPSHPQVHLTTLPLRYILRKKLLKRPEVPVAAMADKVWTIAPAVTVTSRRAYSLPGQFDLVRGTAYTDDFRKEMEGGVSAVTLPTMGYLVKNAVLSDGGLYRRRSCLWLNARSRSAPMFRVDREIDRGAVYSTVEGNRFFGLWLTDDCTTYPLAAAEGVPVTTDHVLGWHMPDYEARLGMTPERHGGLFLKEAVFFDDLGRNIHRRDRFRALGARLRAPFPPAPHPGVFILRRDTGKKRVLHNEFELAQQLRDRRGFKIVDITKDDLGTILGACSGARVVMGVEGSHLMHGLAVLEPGRAVLAIQPPTRCCGVLKWTTDMNEQDFAFVIGREEGDGYRISLEEVERTLDLLP